MEPSTSITDGTDERERAHEKGGKPRASNKGEATISLRWVVPFIRLTGIDPEQVELFKHEGISLPDFVNPDTRIRHSVVMALLARTIERTNEPGLGLRAGSSLEAGDLDPLEYASRCCKDLRDATHCANRYMYLMHGALEAKLIEDGDTAIWQLRITDDVPQPPGVNEFALAAACTYSHRYTGIRNVLREVHMVHDKPTSSAEAYRQIFDQAALRFGMPTNALLFDRAHLDAPMVHAHRGLQKAFEMHVSGMLERLKRTEGTSVRVRQQLVDQLRTGNVSMAAIARRLGMSVPTLRRRLNDENTSQSALLDDVRRELSERYLADPTLAMSDVAFLLGFSHVTGFYKAFRRWSSGGTPAEFRARLCGGRRDG